jgi:serine/threonine protein kinase
MNFIYPKEIVKNYEIISKLGKGVYGEIFSVKNNDTNSLDVFKVLRNDKKFEHSQINEINILKKITESYKKTNDSKIEFVSLFIDDFFFKNHHIIVQKKYSQNLYQEYNKRKFLPEIIKKIIFDILRGLQFLKFNKIIHGDIKPENILFFDDTSYRVVICDFSLSLDLTSENNDKKNFNIQSIWYRAPEILFRNEFDYSIDLWSLGCIAYELYFIRPLFSTKTESDLFSKMICFLGLPKTEIIKSSNITRSLFNLNYELTYEINSNIVDKMKIHRDNMNIHCKSATLKKLMLGIFTWDPNDRKSIESCLKLFKN